MEKNVKFPNHLKAWRSARRLSQQEIADALNAGGCEGATKQKVWKIENGMQRMTPQEALLIATTLSCTVNDLVDGGGPTEKAGKKVDVNASADALVELYRSSTPTARHMFDSVYHILKQETLALLPEIEEVSTSGFHDPAPRRPFGGPAHVEKNERKK